MLVGQYACGRARRGPCRGCTHTSCSTARAPQQPKQGDATCNVQHPIIMHRATCIDVRTTQHTRMRIPGCKAAPHVKYSVQRAPYPVSSHSHNFQHACMPGSCARHARCSMVAHASAQPRTAIPIRVPNNVGRLCGAAGVFEPCLNCKVAPVNRLVDGRRLALCAHARSGVRCAARRHSRARLAASTS